MASAPTSRTAQTAAAARPRVVELPIAETDAALVGALRAGRVDAGKILFERYGRDVERVLFRVLGPDVELRPQRGGRPVIGAGIGCRASSAGFPPGFAAPWRHCTRLLRHVLTERNGAVLIPGGRCPTPP